MSPTEAKAIRQRYGLSTRALAALLRVGDQRTIRRWESGDVPISGPASIVLELMGADELPNRYFPGARQADGVINGIRMSRKAPDCDLEAAATATREGKADA